MVLPLTVSTSPFSSPFSRRCCKTTGTPPIRSRSLMWYLPCGLVSAMCGTRLAIRLKSSSSSRHARLVGDGEQVQDGVGRAAERHDDGDGVLERGLGHDLSRAVISLSSRFSTARPES